MAIKHRVARMEERLRSEKECPEFRQQVVWLPEGLTQAKQRAFMDRYKAQENHEDTNVEVWRLFIVPIPTDFLASRHEYESE